MSDKKFRIYKWLTAGGVMLAALVVYILTTEPTASFWDCPEYIAQAAGMEVGHPPGNPTWLLFARMAAILAPDAMHIAYAVNLTSGIFTALAAMLLTLTIIGFSLRLKPKRKSAALVGGAVGGLCFAFCDTAWFSAVEAEVYAFSIFGTALSFWLAMLWGEENDTSRRARLLILLAYVTGLSIGVHQLNLLCIPALALMMIYMRRPQKISILTAGLTLLLSFGVIACILFGLMPGMIALAQRFELLAVNGLGLRYHSGLVLYLICDLGATVAAIIAMRQGCPRILGAIAIGLALFLSGVFCFGGNIWLGFVLAPICACGYLLWPQKVRYRIYLSMWSIAMLTVGFCVFGIVIIRAAANPPMNEGNPADIFSFSQYLGREQYGSRPLFRGHTPRSQALKREVMTETASGKINAKYPEVMRRDKGPRYAKAVSDGLILHKSNLATHSDSVFNAEAKAKAAEGRDAYVMTDHAYELCYPPELDMWLPRIVSGKDSHLDAYDSWVGMNDSTMITEKVSYAVDAQGHAVGRFDNATGERVKAEAKRPSYLQNFEILFSYQIGYMYFRYLMWNFCGRQSDVPSQGQVDSGNFITGYPLIDKAMVGDDSLKPQMQGAGPDGRNTYYCLPLLLGIIGIVYLLTQRRKGRRELYVILLLFFMTGVAIVLYLNQTPGEARERDYSFIGSFYAFAMLIGLGAAGMLNFECRMLNGHTDCAVNTVPRAQARWELCSPFNIKNSTLKIALSLLLLAVPVQMLVENYADHDRSLRTATSDFARNTLEPLEKDAIIFVNGDNFTFPLWYAQEVEGVRRDVRVINLAYLTTAWYAAQLHVPTQDGKPVPMTMPANLPAYGAFQSVIVPQNGKTADALEALRSVYASKPGKYSPQLKAQYLRFPTASGDSIILDARSVAGTHYLNLAKLLVLDIIATNAASPEPRPIYWSAALPDSHKVGLGRYGEFCGMSVKLTDSIADLKCADPELLADQMLRDFNYGNFRLDLTHRNVWPDEPGYQQIKLLRRAARIAANGLLDTPHASYQDSVKAAQKAVALMNKIEEELPTKYAPYDIFADRYLAINEAVETARIYHKASKIVPGSPELYLHAGDILEAEMARLAAWRRYYDALPGRLRAVVSQDVRTHISGFYAPIAAYFELFPGFLDTYDTNGKLLAAEILENPMFEGFDLERSRETYLRSQALQHLLREARYPTPRTSAIEIDSLLRNYRDEFLRHGGDSLTLTKYTELRGKF